MSPSVPNAPQLEHQKQSQTPRSIYSDLLAAVEREHGMWRVSARVYGYLSRVFQVGVITAAILTAALQSFKPNSAWMIVLPFLVAFFTALDVWLRPTDKWKGFLKDRDHMEELLIKVKNADPGAAEPLNDLLRQFTSLRQEHNHFNVY